MKKLFLLLLATASLGACKKDSNSTSPAAASRPDLLTAKNWRLSAYTSTFTAAGTPAVTTDEYAGLPACERDNFAKFNTNKSVAFDEGPTKCNTTDPQTENGTWDFNSDYTKLTLGDPQLGGFPVPFDVIDLSASTMALRYTYTYSTNGISYSQTINVSFTAF